MTPRRPLSPLIVDDRAIERISRREPLGDAGGDPVLQLLEALARDADGRRQAPHRASADVLELRRRPRSAAARPDRAVGWRRSIGGLVTLAVVVGSGGVAAALAGSPFAAITGLRGVLAQAAGDEVPNRDGAGSGAEDVPRRALPVGAVRGHRRHDAGATAVPGVPVTVPVVAGQPVPQQSVVLLPAGPVGPADAPTTSQGPAPVSRSESQPQPSAQPQPSPTRSPEPSADSAAERAAAGTSERGHSEGGDGEGGAVEPRTGEARRQEPPPSHSASPGPRTSESRHVEPSAHEPRHVDAPSNEPGAAALPGQASS